MVTKPFERLKSSLTHGNIWLYVLSLIKKQKKIYAYALPDQMEKKYSFKPHMVMIYMVLYKLEAEALIKSEFEERRKYYHLTEKGRKTLEQGKKYLIKLNKSL
ncbi:PadR family transcriptional regulator [Candidatus Micrarchaeota archaeon]|nr:PadR family transcriptional regulator [Candidatus Micrarchaeota archaeon]